MRRAVFFRLRLRLRLQNTALYLTPILSLNLEHKLGGGQADSNGKAIFNVVWRLMQEKQKLTGAIYDRSRDAN